MELKVKGVEEWYVPVSRARLIRQCKMRQYIHIADVDVSLTYSNTPHESYSKIGKHRDPSNNLILIKSNGALKFFQNHCCSEGFVSLLIIKSERIEKNM